MTSLLPRRGRDRTTAPCAPRRNRAGCGRRGGRDPRGGQPGHADDATVADGVPGELVVRTWVTGGLPGRGRIGTVYFAADEPLVGPGYDPPYGWVSPYQPGTMTLIDAAHAVFRDDLGHTVHFHTRAGATGFARSPCD